MRIMNLLKKIERNSHATQKTINDLDEKSNTIVKKIIIVGNPNVGKSVLFNNLTGSYVNVSNYPGTSVEVTNGRKKINNIEFQIIDTPGLYSLSSITEEERVTKNFLINENPRIVIHVVDAKNIDRMLPLTLQLIETDIPIILVLNMMDEAPKEGVTINIKLLEKKLGIPVVGAVSISKIGMDTLLKKIEQVILKKNVRSPIKIRYSQKIEKAINQITDKMKGYYYVSKRALCLLYFKDDKDIKNIFKTKERENFQEFENTVKALRFHYSNILEYELAMQIKEISNAY